MFEMAVGILIIIAGFAVSRHLLAEGPMAKFRIFASGGGLLIGGAIFAVAAFNGIFFYAEPGYKYHVRTILGEEKMVSDTGYNTYLFGRYNSWKNAMSVQAVSTGNGQIEAEIEGVSTSANLPPKSLVFLDQVDAVVSATARFELPSDQESFLRLARQYRTPENLLRTELIPAFEETLGATAALMSAEDYFQGGRTEFNNEFESQLTDGIYFVRREERQVPTEVDRAGTANAALGEDQEPFGDDTKTIFIVTKQLDATGQPRRRPQSFERFGITVTTARITDVVPNQQFRERMTLRQQAAADRAIAREQRVQEEEQRLLAITRGEREVAERQAAAKVEQIEQTTDAETRKQLAITEARQRLEQAEIDRQTSEIRLAQARIDAEARQVAADAAAYEKSAILEADNALAQKLEAYVAVQQAWAEAFAERRVPQTVFGTGEDGPGSDGDISRFIDLMTMQAAQGLAVDPSIGRSGQNNR